TVVRGGTRIPHAAVEKPGETRRSRGAENQAGTRIGGVKTGPRGVEGGGGRRRPTRSEPGGRLKYQREGGRPEAGQVNGIVSEGPAPPLGKAIACAGPSDTTLFITRTIRDPEKDARDGHWEKPEKPARPGN